MTTEDNRSAYTAGLRKLADVLDAHPEIPLPYHGSSNPVHIGFHGSDGGERLAAAARAFPCNWAKDPGENWFNLDGQLAGLHVQLYAAREQVCRRVVTGTEDREVEEVVTPAVTRKVTKPVEVVTWECLPLLDARPVVDEAIEADPEGVAEAVGRALAEEPLDLGDDPDGDNTEVTETGPPAEQVSLLDETEQAPCPRCGSKTAPKRSDSDECHNRGTCTGRAAARHEDAAQAAR